MIKRPSSDIENNIVIARSEASSDEAKSTKQSIEIATSPKAIRNDGDGGHGTMPEDNGNVGTATAKWKKVRDIKVGDKIAIVRPSSELSPDVIARSEATNQSTDIARPLESGDESQTGQRTISKSESIAALGRSTGTVGFDEIVSIKKLGREKVWDIEVEGTHNFVGNGILAHNTYISGNLGIGTTAPSYVLDVQHASSKINSKNGYLTNGADYAEYFNTKDTDLQAGEAVCIDVLNPNSVSRCRGASDINIMGIVSTNPAFLGNSSLEKENNPKFKAIAMLGQIPAKVSGENGAIHIGDSLTSASKAGYVMKANAGDSTVGVALENFPTSSSLVEDQSDLGTRDSNSAETMSKTSSMSGLGRTGTIQVMISRRNKSLTVEAVEEKVTQRIANMKIEEEVNRLVASAVEQLKPANTLTLDTNGNVIFANDPTQTVDILANNAEIRNITDSLITLQSDYETLKNKTEERIDKIESTILTSVFEKEYKAEQEIEVGEIVSYNGTSVEKASGENRDNILGVVTGRPSAEVASVVAEGGDGKTLKQVQGDAGQDSSTSDNIGTGTARVTTRGRVTIQVTKENGEIKKGDAITSSTENKGKGTKAVTEGMIIGYALEDARPAGTTATSESTSALGRDTGTVQIAISPVWYALGHSELGSESRSRNEFGMTEGQSDETLLSLTVEDYTLLNGDLDVLGKASFTDIFASGKVSVGLLTLSSTDNSINVTGETLKLQNEFGAKDIEAFGGKIVLTSTGDIKVLNQITAKKYNIDISDLGTASAGKIQIEKGTKDVTIETSALTENSLIFITAEKSDRVFSYEIIKTNELPTGIKIFTKDNVSIDTTVNWWIVN